MYTDEVVKLSASSLKPVSRFKTVFFGQLDANPKPCLDPKLAWVFVSY